MPFTSWDELADSPVLDFTPSTSRAVRSAKVPWTAIGEILEFVFPSGGLLSPVAMPGYPSLLARSLHVEPLNRDREVISGTGTDFDDVNEFGFARVTIEFETPQFDPNPDDSEDPVALLQQRMSVGGEFIRFRSNGLEWSDGGRVSEDVNAGVLIPTFEHQMRWPRVQFPPFAAMRATIGCVNSETRSFSTGVIAPETLLFIGVELQRDILANGDLAWEVGYRFTERRVSLTEADFLGGNPANPSIAVGGWNHFFRSEEQFTEAGLEGRTGFYRLQTRTIFGEDRTTPVIPARPIYSLASFVPLFQEAL